VLPMPPDYRRFMVSFFEDGASVLCIFAQVMTMGEKQILALAVGIQKQNCG